MKREPMQLLYVPPPPTSVVLREISDFDMISMERGFGGSKIRDHLYLGNREDACNLRGLEAVNVTHIVRLCPGIEFDDFPSINYLKIDILDAPGADIKSAIALACPFIDNAIASGGTVFVHCAAGVSRSATVVMAYLMRSEKLDVDDAVNAVSVARPCVSPNIGFMIALYELEAERTGLVRLPGNRVRVVDEALATKHVAETQPAGWDPAVGFESIARSLCGVVRK